MEIFQSSLVIKPLFIYFYSGECEISQCSDPSTCVLSQRRTCKCAVGYFGDLCDQGKGESNLWAKLCNQLNCWSQLVYTDLLDWRLAGCQAGAMFTKVLRRIISKCLLHFILLSNLGCLSFEVFCNFIPNILIKNKNKMTDYRLPLGLGYQELEFLSFVLITIIKIKKLKEH